ncbi:hypothetical protein KSP40_PGU016807 [Platanthera guangdongensis]|uniref:Uncharacterized protein n=1 Tax=Platanthera guangdongensis TaxID=2320717 RepID=A0ABR2M2I0_9ASPA
MELSLLCYSTRFPHPRSSLPEEFLPYKPPSQTLTIASSRRPLRSTRWPRKPLSRGRVLSKEAIQAVQALKLAKSSPPPSAAAGAADDGRMADVFRGRIARLLKDDLLDVLKELQRQNEWEIALQVFSSRFNTFAQISVLIKKFLLLASSG